MRCRYRSRIGKHPGLFCPARPGTGRPYVQLGQIYACIGRMSPIVCISVCISTFAHAGVGQTPTVSCKRRARHGALRRSGWGWSVVKTLDARKSSYLTGSRLGRQCGDCIIWSLMVRETTCSRARNIVCLGTRMPRSSPPLKIGVRVTAAVRWE